MWIILLLLAAHIAGVILRPKYEKIIKNLQQSVEQKRHELTNELKDEVRKL